MAGNRHSAGVWRIVLALALLAGFYLLGVAFLVLLVVLNIANIKGDRVYLALPVLSFGAAAAIILAWIPTRRAFRPPAVGLAVRESDEPALVALVREIADAMRVPAPDQLYLTHVANAAASTDSRLLGLLVRHRRLELGLGLLSTVTVDELRAIVAHELGHHLGGDTRLAHVVYRGQRAIVDTVTTMPRSPFAYPYYAYLWLYLRCAGVVSRAQETSADAWAVRVAGRQATSSVLERLEPTGAALNAFIQRAVRPYWAAGMHPPNLYDGLRASLAAGGPWTEVVGPSAATRPTPYDTHPPLAERLAAVAGATDPGGDRDVRPARSLLRDADAIETAITALLCKAATGWETNAVDWDDGAQTVFTESIRNDIRSLMTLTGTMDGPSAVDHVAALDERALTKLTWHTASLTGCAIDEGRRRLGRLVGITLAAGLVKRKGHRWTIPFTGPLSIVSGDGHPLDVQSLAARLVEGDPAAAQTIRELRAN